MNTPCQKEAMLEINTQNVFTPGTPDVPQGLDIPETSFFQTAQERDQQTHIPEIIKPEYPDINYLVKLGAPFAPEDLPDQGEVFVEFPAYQKKYLHWLDDTPKPYS
ncbi:hypothetical protein K443DRAFT_5684 [Laccaria amethystina LaAM-08-1]|uniref:Uncharacterized protein n=1 Tax=Laccaria amethystina LaAM-08-1 TaxID=1095629 RepID=A0A0C9XN64_9AGAR|nr:hypothetical protein K443DRAFT_5684 [Laccaria amethystina LaAM-08-1]